MPSTIEEPEGMPPTTVCCGHLRSLQRLRRAPVSLTPMAENAWPMETLPPAFPGLGGRRKGWEAPVDAPLFSWMQSSASALETASEMPALPATPAPPAMQAVPRQRPRAHSRTLAAHATHARHHSRTSASVDTADPDATLAQASPHGPDRNFPQDQSLEKNARTSQKQSPGRLRRARSEVPVYAVSAGTKRKAVSALQQFFFQELSRGNDPNGAAAKALLRLNDLSDRNQTKPDVSTRADFFPTSLRPGSKKVGKCDVSSEDASSDEEAEFQRERQLRRSSLSSHTPVAGSAGLAEFAESSSESPLIRPATPIVGQLANRRAIRVGMCG